MLSRAVSDELGSETSMLECLPKGSPGCAPEVQTVYLIQVEEKLVLEKVGIFVKISILVLGVEKRYNS